MHSIGGLVRKDILLIRRFIWLLAIYAIVFSGVVQKDNQTLIYSLFPGLLLILGISSDSQRSAQQFLVSLPVPRNRLVLSKYLSSMIFIVAAVLISTAMNFASDLLYGRPVHLDLMLIAGTFLSMIIFLSIYLPFFYWLGLKGFQVVNVVMMITIMLANGAATWLLTESDSQFLQDRFLAQPGLSWIFLILLTLLASVISYIISCKAYGTRDL
ncbi:ABC-2 transporter permease [Paenibacillus brevis]|uniref:ABC-2 transporter permease n=1 Tax=Paenibacillus brevis TaxID=2841508 RepID=A0ABS6FTB5_9BACL|nr:ABC-2 transporter permease [Paenibacillus brevis]MBU5673463.1 ABC-2 transporter permease [Paenibacillus brevis]